MEYREALIEAIKENINNMPTEQLEAIIDKIYYLQDKEEYENSPMND